MGFVKIEKYFWHGLRIKEDEISLSKTSITFGDMVSEYLENYKYLEIYINKEEKEVGFKKTNDMRTGWKVHDRKRRLCINKRLLELLPLGIYKITKINKDMLVAKYHKN